MVLVTSLPGTKHEGLSNEIVRQDETIPRCASAILNTYPPLCNDHYNYGTGLGFLITGAT